MLARFSPLAKEAMVLVQQESARLRYHWLGTEHLLLGPLRQPGTPASQVLEGLGITRASVERELVRNLGLPPSSDQVLGDEDGRALRTLGIDLREVRARVEEAFGPGALERAVGP